MHDISDTRPQQYHHKPRRHDTSSAYGPALQSANMVVAGTRHEVPLDRWRESTLREGGHGRGAPNENITVRAKCPRVSRVEHLSSYLRQYYAASESCKQCHLSTQGLLDVLGCQCIALPVS